MKYFIYIPLLLLSSHTFAAVDDTALESWWSFDAASGNETDQTGNGNTAVETSGTIASGTGKVAGSRVLAAADTEWFQVTDSADISFGDEDWTIIFWIKPASGFAWTVPLAKWTSGGDLREYYLEFFNDLLGFSVSADGSSGMTHNAALGTSMSAGTWYFVAVGHSAASDEIWISLNAATPITTAHTGGTFDGATDLFIGSYTGGSTNFDGEVDEMAIYRRDLRADLSGFYNSGNGVSYADVSGGGSAVDPIVAIGVPSAGGNDPIISQ